MRGQRSVGYPGQSLPKKVAFEKRLEVDAGGVEVGQRGCNLSSKFKGPMPSEFRNPEADLPGAEPAKWRGAEGGD